MALSIVLHEVSPPPNNKKGQGVNEIEGFVWMIAIAKKKAGGESGGGGRRGALHCHWGN